MSAPEPGEVERARQLAGAWRHVPKEDQAYSIQNLLALDAALTASEALVREMREGLEAAEQHFGPYADITVNGKHDADDVRVIALIRALIAKAGGAK